MLVERNRWLKKLRFRVIHSMYDAIESSMTRRFNRITSAQTIGAPLFPDANISWVFHDETWPRVVHRFRDRAMVRRNRKVPTDDTSQDAGSRVRFDSPGNIYFSADARPDNWIYLHIDSGAHQWRNYRWSFAVRCLTPFRELQFAFRYLDFYNRYRYRFEGDYLHFDIVHRGDFYGSLSKTECRLELGVWYPIQIDVVENYFCCRMGGRTLSVDYDPTRQFRRGPIAVILWEDDGKTNIKAEIRDTRIEEILPRSGGNG